MPRASGKDPVGARASARSRHSAWQRSPSARARAARGLSASGSSRPRPREQRSPPDQSGTETRRGRTLKFGTSHPPRPIENGQWQNRTRSPVQMRNPNRDARREAQAPGRCRHPRSACSPSPRRRGPTALASHHAPAGSGPASFPLSANRAATPPVWERHGYRRSRSYGRSEERRDAPASARRRVRAQRNGRPSRTATLQVPPGRTARSPAAGCHRPAEEPAALPSSHSRRSPHTHQMACEFLKTFHRVTGGTPWASGSRLTRLAAIRSG